MERPLPTAWSRGNGGSSISPVTVLRFRQDLPARRIARALPGGLTFAAFNAERHRIELHALLQAGYSDGFGEVAELDRWWALLSADPEFSSDLVFLILDEDGSIVAAAVCWTSAYVKDLVVAASRRGAGLRQVLLSQVFDAFHRLGMRSVDLKVVAGNGPAIRLYERMGMYVVETLTLFDRD